MLLALREMDVAVSIFLSAEPSFFDYIFTQPVSIQISHIKGFTYPLAQIDVRESCRMPVYRKYASYIPLSACLAEFRVGPYSCAVSYPHASEYDIFRSYIQCFAEIRHIEEHGIKNTAVVPQGAFRNGTPS